MIISFDDDDDNNNNNNKNEINASDRCMESINQP